MASIDSSAPETTSSDNSPTVVRRSTWLKQCGPGSDSGSSGESSDSFASSSSEEKPPRSKSREGERCIKSYMFILFFFFKFNIVKQILKIYCRFLISVGSKNTKKN